MGFTVTHRGDTKDVDFMWYTSLLIQRGMDLGRLRRVPEPGSSRRWLPVWDSQAEARAFAEELRRRSKDSAWEVVEVDGPISEGPLGPIEIRAGRLLDGWGFDLDPLSRLMVQELFPGSCRADGLSIGFDLEAKPIPAAEEVEAVADQVAVILTGLSMDTIMACLGGYRIYQVKAHKTLATSTAVHSGGWVPCGPAPA